MRCFGLLVVCCGLVQAGFAQEAVSQASRGGSHICCASPAFSPRPRSVAQLAPGARARSRFRRMGTGTHALAAAACHAPQAAPAAAAAPDAPQAAPSDPLAAAPQPGPHAAAPDSAAPGALAGAAASGATASPDGVTPSDLALAESCSSEWQIVFCGDIPLDAPAARAACCARAAPAPAPPAARAALAAARAARAAAAAALPPRGDLDPAGPLASTKIDWQFGRCMQQAFAEVPEFSRAPNGSTQVRRRSCAPRARSAAAPRAPRRKAPTPHFAL